MGVWLLEMDLPMREREPNAMGASTVTRRSRRQEEIHPVYFLPLSGLVLDFSITSRLASTHHLRVWVGDTHGVRHHHGVSRGMIGLGLGSWWRPRAPPDFHPPVLSIHFYFLPFTGPSMFQNKGAINRKGRRQEQATTTEGHDGPRFPGQFHRKECVSIFPARSR